MTTLDEELRAARIALRQGQKKLARFHALRAAAIAPFSEEPWLILGAVDSARAAVHHLRRALRLNPHNSMAQRGLTWILSNQSASESLPLDQTQPIRPRNRNPSTRTSSKGSSIVFWTLLLILFACGLSLALPLPILAFVFFPELEGLSFSSQDWSSAAAPPYLSPQESPTHIPSPTEFPSLTPTESPSPTPTLIPTDTPTPPPTQTPTPSLTPSPTATETPTVVPSPTAKPKKKKKKPSSSPNHIQPEAGLALPKGVDEGDPWIEVDLSAQRSYAYIGRSLIRSFIVSTGTAQHPTVQGVYRIYAKYRYANMSGPDYFLRNVPYVMYFYKGYGLHGTYWHNNFGVPMSHGCVNYTIADAAWLFEFADIGTVVYIHE